MLTSLRSALIARFCDIGSVQYILTDFELAAINAVQRVFPEVIVKGYTFHFKQSVLRRIQQLGLQQYYESQTMYPELRSWMRTVMSLCLLPAFAIPLIWNVLQVPPATSQDVDTLVQSMVQHFHST